MQINFQTAGISDRALLLRVGRGGRARNHRKAATGSLRTGSLTQATATASRGWKLETAAWVALGGGAAAALALSFWG